MDQSDSTVFQIEAEETRRRVDVQISIIESLRQRSTGMLALIAGSAYLKTTTTDAWAGTGVNLAVDLVLIALVATAYAPWWHISAGYRLGSLTRLHQEIVRSDRPEHARPEVRDAIYWKFVGKSWAKAVQENEVILRWIRGAVSTAIFFWILNTALWMLLTELWPSDG